MIGSALVMVAGLAAGCAAEPDPDAPCRLDGAMWATGMCMLRTTAAEFGERGWDWPFTFDAAYLHCGDGPGGDPTLFPLIQPETRPGSWYRIRVRPVGFPFLTEWEDGELRDWWLRDPRYPRLRVSVGDFDSWALETCKSLDSETDRLEPHPDARWMER